MPDSDLPSSFNTLFPDGDLLPATDRIGWLRLRLRLRWQTSRKVDTYYLLTSYTKGVSHPTPKAIFMNRKTCLFVPLSVFWAIKVTLSLGGLSVDYLWTNCPFANSWSYVKLFMKP